MRVRVSLRILFHAVAALAIFVCCAAPAHAQTQDCSTLTPGSGEEIQCKMGNILAKNGALINNLQSKVASCAPATDPKCMALQNHLNRAKHAQAGAVAAHGHTSADDYNQLTLKGHYNRNSNRKGGGGGTQTDTVDTSYDSTGTGSTGQTISDSLDDAGGALDDANNTLLSIAAPNPPPFTPAEVYDFTTDEAYPAWLHPELDEKVWIPALFSIKLAGNALEFVEVVADHACNETLVVLGEGGNVSAACAPLALATAALKATAEMMEFADADLVYWNAKGAYKNAQSAVDLANQTGKNVQQAAGDVAALKTELDNLTSYVNNTLTPSLNQIKAKLKVIDDDVLTNQAQIKESLKLLLTPDGHKVLDPGITTCVGSSCPNVLLKCSTGRCSFPMQ